MTNPPPSLFARIRVRTHTQILTALYASHKQPAAFLAANASLVAAIERTAASDPAILVQEMARNLRDAFKAAARPPPAAGATPATAGTPAAAKMPAAGAPVAASSSAGARPPLTAAKPAPTPSTSSTKGT